MTPFSPFAAAGATAGQRAPPDPAPPACVDTEGWFDGKNNCAGYARHADTWCDLYGCADYNGRGPASVHCCACGGGHVPERDEL